MSAPALTVQVNGGPPVSGDNLNTYVQSCDTIPQLRGFIGVQGVQVFVRGTAAPDDGGQGNFYWNSTGVAPDDNGATTVIPTGSVAGSGEWTRISTGSAVTSIATNNGITGGPITSTGTIGLAPISSNHILANITGGSAPPTDEALTAVIDAAIGSTQGDILYRGASAWSALAPGTLGQFLQSGGAAANPSWGTTTPTTWIPVLNIGGSPSGITYTTQSGNYLQFGVFIIAELTIILSSKGSNTGNVTITGLPIGANNSFGMANMNYYASISTIGGAISGYVQGSTITPIFQESGGPTALTNSNLGNTSQLIMTCVYIAT